MRNGYLIIFYIQQNQPDKGSTLKNIHLPFPLSFKIRQTLEFFLMGFFKNKCFHSKMVGVLHKNREIIVVRDDLSLQQELKNPEGAKPESYFTISSQQLRVICYSIYFLKSGKLHISCEKQGVMMRYFLSRCRKYMDFLTLKGF